MSTRFYPEDYDEDVLVWGRWQGALKSALNGKAGQAHLRAIIEAMERMPDKRLIRGSLCDEDDAVCALGAYARHRGWGGTALRAKWIEYEEERGPDCGAAEFGRDHLGMTFTLAWAVAEANDEITGTPEERYQRMLAWLRGRLVPGRN